MARPDRHRTSASRTDRRRATEARRRRSRQPDRGAPVPAARGRRRWMVVAVIGVLVAAVAAAAVWAAAGDDDPSIAATLRSPVLDPEGEVLPIDTTPDAYTIDYRIESVGAGGVAARTGIVAVRRPFDGRVRSYVGDPDTGVLELDVRSTLGRYADTTGSEQSDVADGLPAAAIGDLRIDGVLDDLVRAGLFVPKERREVLGRACQVYRTGQALETLVLLAPTEQNHADVCIDAGGLVLEQVAVIDGEAQVYEVAIAVDTDPALDDATFTVEGNRLTIEDGGSELDEIDPTAPPISGYWQFPSPPAGYEHVGRYRLRVLAPADTTATTTTVGVDSGPAVIDSYVDVYATGASFLVVHQGPAATAPTRDTSIALDVDAGALGAAQVVPSLTGSTLAVTTGSTFVEITGPLSSEALAAVAAELTAS